MARERRHVRAQPLAGAQADQRGARHLRPLLVVVGEADATVGQLGAGARLGDVVQQSAEAQPAAAGQLVGQRLGQQGAHRRGQRLVAERSGGIALEIDAGLQDLERVPVDVEVVVWVLLDAAQGGQLGQDRRDEVELVHEAKPAHGRVGGHDAAQLGEDALLGGARQPRRVRADRGRRFGVDLEAELGGQARDAQRAQRIGRRTRRR